MIAPLPEAILNLLAEHLKHGRVDVEDAFDLISEVVKQFPSAILFLDGLDELTEAHRLVVVKRLWMLIKTAGSTTIKIYLSGRETATLLTKPPEVDISTIHLRQELIGRDICRFVKHEVYNLIDAGELVVGDPSLPEEIIAALSRGSKGMCVTTHKIWSLY